MKRTVLIQLIVALFVLTGCDTPDASTSEATIEPVESQIAATSSQEEVATGETVDELAEESGEDANEVSVKEPAAEELMEASSGLPAADVLNEEGGPERLVGGINYTDFSIPIVMTDPSPALLDMANIVEGNTTQFAPIESQILGIMTSPVAPPPLSYAFNLPEVPSATPIDVDNDGEADEGVQIFWLAMASNINGGSYLEQLDQKADFQSFITDPLSGNIEEGSLLVFAADDQQGFPSGFGDDGVLFSEDDPAVGLPQGYTVVRFGPDGFTYDRAQEAQLDVLEGAGSGSSDFSDQGILESYNNLIDEMSERYSFTEFRDLDWEEIRAEYLPRVEEIDALSEEDFDTAIGLYAAALSDMALSLRDAHVQAGINDTSSPSFLPYALALFGPLNTNLGANTVELDDGRIIVTDVAPGSPAEEAGWNFGTEIVSIDGAPVEERIPDVNYISFVGTEEGQRLNQVANLLKFPSDGAEVSVEAILPDGSSSQSFTMTPGAYTLPDRLQPINQRGFMPIEFTIQPGYGYINWDSFEAPEIRMAVWEEFLREVKETPDLNGVILDMRGNSGGWDNLYFTMASYFFSEEDPVSMHWIDQDVYDTETGEFVREVSPEFLLSAPDPDLYYDGPVLLLVDNNCASSCEFFSQFLQSSGRATVVAQYSTKGAGAPINRVDLPGPIVFQYTKGRAYFAGTDEFNLEAKGVTPDVVVPTTEESELAKLNGEDPVLQMAVNMLNDMAGQ